VPRSIADPLGSLEANVNGTQNVLLAARESGVRCVIYASSSSVYGDTPTLPKREDMPTYPLSPYAVHKLTGELLCRVFTRIYGLETVALRYFNVFGLRQDPGSVYAAVIPHFLTALLKKKSVLSSLEMEGKRAISPILLMLSGKTCLLLRHLRLLVERSILVLVRKSH
jgi:UDP-glucose 4-epimerase